MISELARKWGQWWSSWRPSCDDVMQRIGNCVTSFWWKWWFQVLQLEFSAFDKKRLQFWHLEKRILYRALPFVWVIVLEKTYLEYWRLFHQSCFALDGREANWKLSTRNCLLETLLHNYPDCLQTNTECVFLYLAWSSLSCSLPKFVWIQMAFTWLLTSL